MRFNLIASRSSRQDGERNAGAVVWIRFPEQLRIKSTIDAVSVTFSEPAIRNIAKGPGVMPT